MEVKYEDFLESGVYVEELEKEISRLTQELDKTRLSELDKEYRINKAIEYIENHKLDRKPNTTTRLEAHTLQEWKLLEILKGE